MIELLGAHGEPATVEFFERPDSPLAFFAVASRPFSIVDQSAAPNLRVAHFRRLLLKSGLNLVRVAQG